ncbi:MAG: energy-coupled thiamine transporter ThiT [Clostridiales bacterium]|nr:energy-coupled thiamine transporter ThiT [Clostridiales bacterium]
MSLQILSLSSYFQQMKDKFLELDLTLTVISVLIALFIVLALAFINRKTGGLKWDTRKLTYGAVCIALSFVLSYIRLWKMPNGGSVTAASMLPMLAYGFMAGPLWGTVTGIAYSVLQFLQESYFLSLPQFLFDYIFPFVAISGLSGVFKTKYKKLNLYSGFALAVVVRYACHVIAGIAFWAESAPYNPILYSFVYNSFVFIDAIPCFILISIPAIQRLFKRIPKK